MADIGTTDWWRDRLLRRYAKTHKARSVHAAVYDLEGPSPVMPEGYANVYKRILAQAKTPWGRLVVDIVGERLKVKGFQVGESTDLDADLWTVFRRNRIEALQRQVHREALALGTSYVSVWDDDDGARLAFESAMETVHETVAGEPHETASALKVWHDSVNGYVRTNLYLPEGIYKWQTTQTYEENAWRSSIENQHTSIDWEMIDTIDNELGQVPIVPFVVRPSWEGYGNSDLVDIIPVIARIESLTANTQLAVELGALRQKWATGIEIPKDPDTDAPIESFKLALDRLWYSEDSDTRFGSFEQTDVRPYLQAVSDAIGQLSAVSRIPTLYFNQSELSNPPSAASLEASETGLINKVQERADRFSESWETVAAFARHFAEGGEVDPSSVYTLWADPRTRSEAQTVDAATKLAAINLPFEAVMEFIGYSPTEIQRLKAQRAADTFDRLLNSPIATATPAEVPARVTEAPNDGEG